MRVSNLVGAGLGIAAPLFGSALGNVFTPCCRDGVTVFVTETTVQILKTPIAINAFFPTNTDIVLDENLTVVVTDAPTHLRTKVTEIDSTSLISVYQ
jgi:hypothetical protein